MSNGRFVLKNAICKSYIKLIDIIRTTEFIDEEDEDLGCVPLTSTPEKDCSGKHELTPSSKQDEPRAKKLNTSESPQPASTHLGKFVHVFPWDILVSFHMEVDRLGKVTQAHSDY